MEDFDHGRKATLTDFGDVQWILSHPFAAEYLTAAP